MCRHLAGSVHVSDCDDRDGKATNRRRLEAKNKWRVAVSTKNVRSSLQK